MTRLVQKIVERKMLLLRAELESKRDKKQTIVIVRVDTAIMRLGTHRLFRHYFANGRAVLGSQLSSNLPCFLLMGVILWSFLCNVEYSAKPNPIRSVENDERVQFTSDPTCVSNDITAQVARHEYQFAVGRRQEYQYSPNKNLQQ